MSANLSSLIEELKRDDLVLLARSVESAERYEDMCAVMTKVVKDLGGEDLLVEDRNLLSVAYKNVVGARRASLRALNAEESGPLTELYKSQLQQELKLICEDILNLLLILIVEGKEDEGQVFYLKMAADYYRYLAECIPGSAKYPASANDNYQKAFDIASKIMAPTNPIRLGLALNFSVCKYEIVKETDAACELAKAAFDEAIAQLDKLEETDYKDSTLIMQLLRDNLTLWTTSNGEDDDDEN